MGQLFKLQKLSRWGSTTIILCFHFRGIYSLQVSLHEQYRLKCCWHFWCWCCQLHPSALATTIACGLCDVRMPQPSALASSTHHAWAMMHAFSLDCFFPQHKYLRSASQTEKYRYLGWRLTGRGGDENGNKGLKIGTEAPKH